MDTLKKIEAILRFSSYRDEIKLHGEIKLTKEDENV